MSENTVVVNVKEIPPVEVGSAWEWQRDMKTRGELRIGRGSIAIVLARTDDAPHGEVMERGYNLLVSTDGVMSVWASFEQCVSRGLLVRVK